MNVVRALKLGSEYVATQPQYKPLVSVIVPAFNEAAIIEKNLARLCEYLESLAGEYRWELIVVNDGSADATGELAEAFAGAHKNVQVLHHQVNLNLGQALRTGFRHCRGDFVVTMDIDLSYAPDHIGRMLEKLRESGAHLVLASPYMAGGQCSNVPWEREILSRQANRYLSRMAAGNPSTLTGMVRAYEGKFLRTLKLKSTGMEINTEIIYKAQVLNARMVEIPAHLHWETSKSGGVKRVSHIKILRHIGQCLFSGFIFKPAFAFLLPALAALILGGFSLGKILWEGMAHYQSLGAAAGFGVASIGTAFAAAFHRAPHAFWIGGMGVLLAVQFIGFSLLARQNQHYFEELFHLGAQTQ